MNLDEIKTLCDEATPGPWKIFESNHVAEVYTDLRIIAADHGSPPTIADARFISMAREELPKLLKVAKLAKFALKMFDRDQDIHFTTMQQLVIDELAQAVSDLTTCTS